MPLPSWMMPFGQERGDIPKATGIEIPCPKCKHRRMDEIFSRNVSRASDDRTGYQCPACKYSTLNEPKAPEDSKVSIAFQPGVGTHGRFEGPTKKIESDETRSADKKPFWKKPYKPGPSTYFCPTCNKDRKTLGKKCPVCHNEIATTTE